VEEETDELDPVELEIDEFGGFYVITADFEEETPGKQNLIRTLKRAIENNNEGMQLKIRVHEMAKLQALVDGMDAGTIAGFAEIQVNQVENL
jgi:biopolymer transport protein ExbD